MEGIEIGAIDDSGRTCDDPARGTDWRQLADGRMPRLPKRNGDKRSMQSKNSDECTRFESRTMQAQHMNEEL